MNHLQDLFLSQFDLPVRKHIIEYCKQISEKKYDVYILLARKAACFISVLESLGLVSLDGVIVSDRVQEYNPEWLKGKRVAIIDDTIISGSSIYKLIKKLESFGVSDVFVHAFCIDSYWFVEDLLCNKDKEYLMPPYMKLDHASCIRFCRQIVSALSIIPRPYNIDFPTYEIKRLSKSSYSAIINDEKWKVVDTSTTLQRQNGVETYSLNFKRDLLKEFYHVIGSDFSDVLFVKIRLFSRIWVDGRDISTKRYITRVVPYVMFNPVNVKMVDLLVDAICHAENIYDDSLKNHLGTNCGKMLFIQYYFSEVLLRWWIKYTEGFLCKGLEPKRNSRSLNLLFSPQIIEFISNFTFSRSIKTISGEESEMFFSENIPYSGKDVSVNPLIITNSLTQKFLDLYYEKELESRRIVHEKGKSAFVDQTYAEYVDRLEDGISLIKLKKQISDYVENSTDANLFLSTFLDNAIDTGIIVPITVTKKDRIYRGYRHGEEVIWGDINDKMMAFYFETIFGKNGSVPKLWFEKLLVLFLKIGLRRKLLSEFPYNTPKNEKMRLIGIRSYLYGQITVTYDYMPNESINFNPVLDNETSGYWTSRRLEDIGVLTANKKKGYSLCFDKMVSRIYEEKKRPNETSDLDSRQLREVKNIAEVFQLCYKNKYINDKDLVLLTSCVSIEDNLSSIIAELFIYRKNIDVYLHRINNTLADGMISIDFLTSLRQVKKSILWTAINSGKEKYLDFKQGLGLNTIHEIEEKLAETNSFAGRAWTDYWAMETELVENRDENLIEVHRRAGILLVDILQVMTCMHLLFHELVVRNGAFKQIDDEYKDVLEEIKELKAKQKSANNKSFEKDIKEKIKKRDSLSRKKEYWDSYYQESLDQVESSIERLSLTGDERLRGNTLYQFISSGDLSVVPEERICQDIKLTVSYLSSMKDEASQLFQDYSLIIPQWGKAPNSVLYKSLISVNYMDIGDEEREDLERLLNIELLAFEREEYCGVKNAKTVAKLSISNTPLTKSSFIIGGRGQWCEERMLWLAGRILTSCQNAGKDVSITLSPSLQGKGVRAYYNDKTQKFDSLRGGIADMLPANSKKRCVMISTGDQEYNIDSCRTVLAAKLNGTIIIEKNEEVSSPFSHQLKESMVNKKVFISYSRRDYEYKERLKMHLKQLGAFNILDSWSCEEINEDKWDDQIQRELSDSAVVVYMLSADFFCSPYILSKEVENVMTESSNKKVLCVIVKDFVGLDTIEEYIRNVCVKINPTIKAVLKLKNFQYLPYGEWKDGLSGDIIQKIVCLANYSNKTGNHIDTAYAQIAERVMKLLEK